MKYCHSTALSTLLASALLAPVAPAIAQQSTRTDVCPALLQHTFLRLQDEKPQSLCQYRGKVLLVVNTASYCGFTGQYKELETLHERYQDKGLVVLGFPSNDFSQESGSNKEIAAFCENTFGVRFPMFSKSSVKGPQANALYQQLAQQTGQAPRWNFHKYLIGRDGTVVDNYASLTSPDSRSVVRAIEQQLARPAPGGQP
ncbi:MAG: glutathione peroxidase [Giesbergeria sp.]|nr:glutathione peroxidase [Giesbergeria sp.]